MPGSLMLTDNFDDIDAMANSKRVLKSMISGLRLSHIEPTSSNGSVVEAKIDRCYGQVPLSITRLEVVCSYVFIQGDLYDTMERFPCLCSLWHQFDDKSIRILEHGNHAKVQEWLNALFFET
jgi:hypothetical protein